ncbi:hypothetical protein H0H93_016807 [Arthromyces matolae]|nr:hypothetical protein H0H93_016807 [Arthromyces matolae]
MIRLYSKAQVDYLLKFLSREAVLWGQLSHSNVLAFYGLFRHQNQVCFVAPWIKNGDIQTYLKNNPDAHRRPLAGGVAAGLSYLHENDIIHGDLKGVRQVCIMP